MADRVKQIHEEERLNLEQANGKYKDAADSKRRVKIFHEGDLVMAYLHKNNFPARTYGKLKSRKYGPFRIKRKINDNAYMVELLEDMAISNTFNVVDLFAYHPDEPMNADSNSRKSFLEKWETDVEQLEEAPLSIHRYIISYIARDGDSGVPWQVDNIVSVKSRAPARWIQAEYFWLATQTKTGISWKIPLRLSWRFVDFPYCIY